MAFTAKRRAQGHYNAGTRILLYLQQSRSVSSLYKDVNSLYKDIGKGIKHLQKAVELDPSFADAFNNLSQLWIRSGEVHADCTSANSFRANAEEALAAAVRRV